MAHAFVSRDSGLTASSPFRPLVDFYASAGRPFPPIEVLRAEDLPEPFAQLLAHSESMTRTLEAFHGVGLDLRVLSRTQTDDLYARHIVLCPHESAVPVEFGTIRLDLSAFAPHLRELILAERVPLGRILEEHQVAFHSRPRAFFRVDADALLGSTLRVEVRQTLFGRCNRLTDPEGRSLAEIVEIVSGR